MLKKTGPGKVAESSAVPVGGVRASLYNFDIDGADPKPEHTAFLLRRVVPVINGKAARCWLQGSVSQSGSDAHNLELSKQRVTTSLRTWWRAASTRVGSCRASSVSRRPR